METNDGIFFQILKPVMMPVTMRMMTASSRRKTPTGAAEAAAADKCNHPAGDGNHLAIRDSGHCSHFLQPQIMISGDAINRCHRIISSSLLSSSSAMTPSLSLSLNKWNTIFSPLILMTFLVFLICSNLVLLVSSEKASNFASLRSSNGRMSNSHRGGGDLNIDDSRIPPLRNPNGNKQRSDTFLDSVEGSGSHGNSRNPSNPNEDEEDDDLDIEGSGSELPLGGSITNATATTSTSTTTTTTTTSTTTTTTTTTTMKPSTTTEMMVTTSTTTMIPFVGSSTTRKSKNCKTPIDDEDLEGSGDCDDIVDGSGAYENPPSSTPKHETFSVPTEPPIIEIPYTSTTIRPLTTPADPDDSGDDFPSYGNQNEPKLVPPRIPSAAPSFFARPGILAAVIGGTVVGLLCAILMVMFIVYRMRKKDEGSYPIDKPMKYRGNKRYPA